MIDFLIETLLERFDNIELIKNFDSLNIDKIKSLSSIYI